jgi:glucosamine-phosphate N-acetyltransferase
MTTPIATLHETKTMNPTITQIEPNSPPSDGPLFSSTLISPEVISVLPENYTIRPLRRSDYSRGYLDVLRVLTTVGDISEEAWNKRYDWITSRNDEYYMLVVCDGADRVVGTGSLIVERKFIHELGMVGHIEDIAVEKGQQGMKLGLRIIQALDFVAAKVGCYKVCFTFFTLFVVFRANCFAEHS